MINARIETVTTKPAFKAAAARRRCLLPSLGYYEWQKTDHGKVPYFLHDPGGQLFTMAGLYELWRDPTLSDDDPNRWLWTCTIITQQATDLLGLIHDRNPVIVPTELHQQWLDCSSEDPDTARRILDQIPEARLEPDVVSSAVGNVRNNGPELIQPIDVSGLPSQDGSARAVHPGRRRLGRPRSCRRLAAARDRSRRWWLGGNARSRCGRSALSRGRNQRCPGHPALSGGGPQCTAGRGDTR
jgi:putative SOS response-associated peptidase YedK